MGTYTLKKLLRAPLMPLAILLFGAVISAVLCGLHLSVAQQQENYEQIYHTIPVEVKVTNLLGTSDDNLNLPYWAEDAITFPHNRLASLLKDPMLKCHHTIAFIDGERSNQALIGVTNTAVMPTLRRESGRIITWKDGYTEAHLTDYEEVCLVPQAMADRETLSITLEHKEYYMEVEDGQLVQKVITKSHTYELKVVGYYDGASVGILCPYKLVEYAYTILGEEFSVDAARATLANNDDLDKLYERRGDWFAAPNPSGEKTPWDWEPYTHYPFALEIDDYRLKLTAQTLQSSITVSKVCTVIVFALSTAAGVCVGWLTMHRRRREIALMRTMGTPDLKIYACFALEQLLCFTVGIALGGAYGLWQPWEKLLALLPVFFAGLSAALIVFLKKKLIITIKEEE